MHLVCIQIVFLKERGNCYSDVGIMSASNTFHSYIDDQSFEDAKVCNVTGYDFEVKPNVKVNKGSRSMLQGMRSLTP
ncbi:hypothetical protein Y032_0181g829 [Ancylostoma ceylanicum]|uniref:Uncharacterized protein n=1 Tax=Ancylostoma ceylanicum TaxID=53326 RepID=A0A016SSE7_9BILA|nr:hypothetical protein Y032_0181g829 [Ancylostoma ceylanicum]